VYVVVVAVVVVVVVDVVKMHDSHVTGQSLCNVPPVTGWLHKLTCERHVGGSSFPLHTGVVVVAVIVVVVVVVVVVVAVAVVVVVIVAVVFVVVEVPVVVDDVQVPHKTGQSTFNFGP
jgi:hypothetical protein